MRWIGKSCVAWLHLLKVLMCSIIPQSEAKVKWFVGCPVEEGLL
jgi:hypothetical protein